MAKEYNIALLLVCDLDIKLDFRGKSRFVRPAALLTVMCGIGNL